MAEKPPFGAVAAVPAAQPLYRQVKDLLRQRIQDRSWKPGAPIPSEFALAEELGVSQGTVRKALGELTADKLLVRRQGRGTFVAQHTPESMLFRFFNFYDQAGVHVSPETAWVKVRTTRANTAERVHLGLRGTDEVIRIVRLRLRDGAPFVVEKMSVPAALFPGLGRSGEIPNTLYDHFQREYGVTVTGGIEKLDVVAADGRDAEWLAVAPGTPLLRLDRLTQTFEDRPIEWRVSLCALGGAHYRVQLG